jgi:hypothetical protein
MFFGPGVVLIGLGLRSAGDPMTNWNRLTAVALLGAGLWLAWSGTQAIEDGQNSIFGTKPVLEEGDAALWLFPVGIGVVALIAGWLRVAKPLAIGFAATAIPLALAIVTTPRGDEDGLWALIFLMIPVFGFILAGLAGIGATVHRLDDRANRRAEFSRD